MHFSSEISIISQAPGDFKGELLVGLPEDLD